MERSIKTPKKKKRKSDEEEAGDRVFQSSGPRRKSDRRSNAKSYAEVSSDEEEEDMQDARVGASDEDEDVGEASEGEEEVPALEKDVEMVDHNDEQAASDEESEAELELEPEPPKRAARSRDGKTANGISSSPVKEKRKTVEQKAVKPAKRTPKAGKDSPKPAKGISRTTKTTVKSKGIANGDAEPSSPAFANGTPRTRRSTRIRN